MLTKIQSPQCPELKNETVNEKIKESKVRRDGKEIRYCIAALL